MTTIRGRSEPGTPKRIASCLLLSLLGSGVLAGVPVAGQDQRVPDPLVQAELKEEAMSVILAMARHILSADVEAERVDVSEVPLPWRGVLEMFEGRRGVVALTLSQGYSSYTRWYVPELPDILPELSAEVAAQLSAEGYPVRGGLRHRADAPELPPGTRGQSSRIEWRDHDDVLLAACDFRLRRPEDRVPGESEQECRMYDDIELVVTIGYPVLFGPYMDAPVTVTRSMGFGPQASPGRRTDFGFGLRAERGPDGWFVSQFLPQVTREGPWRGPSPPGDPR